MIGTSGSLPINIASWPGRMEYSLFLRVVILLVTVCIMDTLRLDQFLLNVLITMFIVFNS